MSDELDTEETEGESVIQDFIAKHGIEEPAPGVEVKDIDLQGADLRDSTIEDVARKKAIQEELGAVPTPPARQEIKGDQVMRDGSTANSPVPITELFARDTFLGEVEVDESERSTFLRSALLDQPIKWSFMHPSAKVEVEIFIPTTKESTAMVDALQQLLSDKKIDSTDKWHYCLQVLYMHVAVARLDGKQFGSYDRELAERQSHKQLVAYFANWEMIHELGEMSSARWSLLSHAIQIADKKLQICNEGLSDRSFFGNAGAS